MTEPTAAMKREATAWVHDHYGKPLFTSRWTLGEEDFAYGLAHAAELIAAWLRKRAREYDCQDNPGIECEACVCDNVAGEIARGDWLPDPSTPEPEENRP